jgi:hypothetical protein
VTEQPSLRAISRIEFNVAQACLLSGFTAELLAVVLGGFGAQSPRSLWWTAPAVVCLAFTTLVAKLIGERYTSAANDILRRLDVSDGLGKPIDPFVAVDLIDDASAWVRRRAARTGPETYFGSTQHPSPRRLLEHVRESAWWTKRLANDMARFAAFVTFVLVVVGFMSLVAALDGSVPRSAAEVAAPWVQAVVVLLLSQSPFQAYMRYRAFSEGAGKAQERAAALLRCTPTEADALDAAADYHLVRQSAPVIATLWYNHRRPDLNARWEAAVGSLS